MDGKTMKLWLGILCVRLLACVLETSLLFMEATSTTSSGASSVDGRSLGGSSDYLNIGMFQNQDSGLNGLDQGGASSFDLNDFPSLGGGGNGLSQALRQQQQMAAQQQMMKGSNMYRLATTGQNQNFSMANEDFPALSSGAAASAVGPSTLLSGTAPQRKPGSNGSAGPFGMDQDGRGRPGDGGTSLLGGAGLGGLAGLKGLPTQQAGRAPVPIGSSAAGSALSGDFGLLGLLGIIRMTDADRNALALGSDLTMLGLNLGSSEQLYSAFSGPWSEASATKEPHFQLPSCYYMQPPALKTGHLSKFQLETLFYIFYALPKDVLQAYAAQELYAREWRYHGESKLWFKVATAADGVNISGSGPQFLYFDINSWERRLFSGNGQNLSSGFLSEDEVRVKFPGS